MKHPLVAAVKIRYEDFFLVQYNQVNLSHNLKQI